MSNVVIGYPTISTPDFEWIQDIRRDQDTLYEAVNPHFTFVFPTKKLDVDQLSRHVRSKAEATLKINFALTTAIVVEDDSKAFFHTFLVPTQGNDEIVELHDLLYTGDLASELRHDIPFIPHVGIATHTDNLDAEQLTDSINAKGVRILGFIDGLTIASYDGTKVIDKEQIPLI